MNIHLCIESTNKEKLQHTLDSIKDCNEKVTYQTYTLTSDSVQSMWKELSTLDDDTYLLFVKEGDKLNSLSSLSSLNTNIDVYLLSNDKIRSYPDIRMSPFSLSNFYAGRYNNHHFCIKAKLLDSTKPNLAFGKAWIIDIVLSLLFIDNALAKEAFINVLAPESPSLMDVIGGDEIRLKIIPFKYGYHLADMIYYNESNAGDVYKKEIERRISKTRLSKNVLLVKSIIHPKKYKQFYHTATFKSKYANNWNQIPIIINNFNRLEYLLQLITSLEKRGVKNIHILDNNSTYPPLLAFYKTTPYKVHYLGNNLGYRALWKSEVYHLFKNDYYAYTDSDLTICEECPDNFMEYFMDLHKKYSTIWKVGFSLNIYDLPKCFSKRREVQHWEKQFQEIEIEKDVFYAAIDTTFAIYKPIGISINPNSLRVSGKYGMRHLPWYIDSDHLSPEDTYYINSCTQSTHWSTLK